MIGAAVLGPACGPSPTERRLAALAARVDSLAATVTAMRSALEAGARRPPALPESLTVSTAGAATLGSASAPVVIVAFSDYQCPFCARHALETLPELRRRYIDRGLVRYVMRDLPLPVHPLAAVAARAARCAADQGSGEQGSRRYWAYHDGLFRNQATLGDSTFARIAAAVGLDLARWRRCLASPDVAARVAADSAEAARGGLRATPAFVVGRATAPGRVTGEVIPGAYPIARFTQAIEAALARSPRLSLRPPPLRPAPP